MVEKARDGSENAVATLGDQGKINNLFSEKIDTITNNNAALDISNDAYLNI